MKIHEFKHYLPTLNFYFSEIYKIPVWWKQAEILTEISLSWVVSWHAYSKLKNKLGYTKNYP